MRWRTRAPSRGACWCGAARRAPHAARRARSRSASARSTCPAATARACTRQPIPRIGGLAIAIGILVPALIFVEPRDGPLEGILIGIPIVAAIGLYDDVRGLSASKKMLLVLLAALIPVVGYDMYFRRIGLPFVELRRRAVARHPAHADLDRASSRTS